MTDKTLSWFIQWTKWLSRLICPSPFFVSLSLRLGVKCSICYVKFSQRYESCCCTCWGWWINVGALGYLDHVKYDCAKSGFYSLLFTVYLKGAQLLVCREMTGTRKMWLETYATEIVEVTLPTRHLSVSLKHYTIWSACFAEWG